MANNYYPPNRKPFNANLGCITLIGILLVIAFIYKGISAHEAPQKEKDTIASNFKRHLVQDYGFSSEQTFVYTETSSAGGRFYLARNKNKDFLFYATKEGNIQNLNFYAISRFKNVHDYTGEDRMALIEEYKTLNPSYNGGPFDDDPYGGLNTPK